MHIEKYTKVPLDNSGENFLYIKNQCIGCFKGEEGSSYRRRNRNSSHAGAGKAASGGENGSSRISG